MPGIAANADKRMNSYPCLDAHERTSFACVFTYIQVELKNSLFLQCWLFRPGPGPNIKFLNEVESVRKAVEELKRQNINKIIAIGHSGIDIDQKVAKEVEGVDIVVGGHEHALLYTGKQLSLTMLYLYP